ncbi:DUF4229 domain-containing protein [uncultured Agrococcus sp.]|uniref:DUF4229 domain-containing protein n=1 Tax=uncultured Agrococcus sp. TaxID=382258 RepID=UPI0025E3497B|nr:DUF4229 domain-containing protein [uncultured Agrococcus sp.]
MTVFLKYAAIRLSLFAIPFLVMVFVGWHPLLAGGLSLIFAALASYIFLRKQKAEVSEALTERAERRKREKDAAAAAKERDENVEDAILDEQAPEQDARPESDERADSTAADDDGAASADEPGIGADDASPVNAHDDEAHPEEDPQTAEALPDEDPQTDRTTAAEIAEVDETSTGESTHVDEKSTTGLDDADAQDDEPDAGGHPKLD